VWVRIERYDRLVPTKQAESVKFADIFPMEKVASQRIANGGAFSMDMDMDIDTEPVIR
jgi:hypothetical protein